MGYTELICPCRAACRQRPRRTPMFLPLSTIEVDNMFQTSATIVDYPITLCTPRENNKTQVRETNTTINKTHPDTAARHTANVWGRCAVLRGFRPRAQGCWCCVVLIAWPIRSGFAWGVAQGTRLDQKAISCIAGTAFSLFAHRTVKLKFQSVNMRPLKLKRP